MTEIRSWSDTPAAQFRAALGAAEPEMRSMDEVHAWHRAIPVITVPDTRSPIEIAAARTRAAAQTKSVTIDHNRVEALAADRLRRTNGAVIRPGGEDASTPHWSAERNTGLPWRMISYTSETEERAIRVVEGWMAEDLADQMAEREAMRRQGIAF